MSHELDMTNGRANMAYAGEKPWHGLGEELPANADLETWRKAAGLEWEVHAAQTQFHPKGTSRVVTVPSSNVLYRTDTFDPLGVVSDRYKVVQPGEILEFYRDLMDRFGFKLETAGSLKGGKRVWALANTGQETPVGEFSQDIVKRYVLLATSYDGTMATQAMQTSVRVVCQNTLNFAVNKKDPRVKVSHISEFDPQAVKADLGLDTTWETFTEQIAELSKRPVSEDEAAEYYVDVFYPNREIDWEDPEPAVINKVAQMYDLLENAPGQDIGSAHNTAWGLVNSVTYFADHARNTQTRDNRLDSAWFGTGRSLKERAFDRAMALVS